MKVFEDMQQFSQDFLIHNNFYFKTSTSVGQQKEGRERETGRGRKVERKRERESERESEREREREREREGERERESERGQISKQIWVRADLSVNFNQTVRWMIIIQRFP